MWKKLVLMLLLNHGPATFDAWTTQGVVHTPGGYERNPIVRPFARGPAVYVVVNGDGIIADVLWLTGHKKAARIFGAAVAVEHTALGIHNLQVIRGR